MPKAKILGGAVKSYT